MSKASNKTTDPPPYAGSDSPVDVDAIRAALTEGTDDQGNITDELMEKLMSALAEATMRLTPGELATLALELAGVQQKMAAGLTDDATAALVVIADRYGLRDLLVRVVTLVDGANDATPDPR